MKSWQYLHLPISFELPPMKPPTVIIVDDYRSFFDVGRWPPPRRLLRDVVSTASDLISTFIVYDLETRR